MPTLAVATTRYTKVVVEETLCWDRLYFGAMVKRRARPYACSMTTDTRTCSVTLHSIGCLCDKVETLTLMLEQLDAIGRNSSTTAVVLRMKLAALTTELIAAHLIERARRG